MFRRKPKRKLSESESTISSDASVGSIPKRFKQFAITSDEDNKRPSLESATKEEADNKEKSEPCEQDQTMPTSVSDLPAEEELLDTFSSISISNPTKKRRTNTGVQPSFEHSVSISAIDGSSESLKRSKKGGYLKFANINWKQKLLEEYPYLEVQTPELFNHGMNYTAYQRITKNEEKRWQEIFPIINNVSVVSQIHLAYKGDFTTMRSLTSPYERTLLATIAISCGYLNGLNERFVRPCGRLSAINWAIILGNHHIALKIVNMAGYSLNGEAKMQVLRLAIAANNLELVKATLKLEGSKLSDQNMMDAYKQALKAKNKPIIVCLFLEVLEFCKLVNLKNCLTTQEYQIQMKALRETSAEINKKGYKKNS